MIAVITGDIINSGEAPDNKWMDRLKGALNKLGNSPEEWEIYRGDSYQVKLAPEKALEAAIYIKTVVKQTKNIDVRMAIGLGEEASGSERITESSGNAYTYSGRCFDELKKRTLAVRSPDKEFDEEVNLYISLALLVMDRWLPNTAKIVKVALENPELNQKELANLLNKSTSTISEGLKRAGFEEIMRMIKRYQKLVAKHFNHGLSLKVDTSALCR